MANKLPQDNRLKLQALSLANDCYKYKMDLLTNASVLSDAIRFVENSRDKLEAVNSDIRPEERRRDNITGRNNKDDIQGFQRILQGTSVQLEQQTKLFNTLKGKEFWIWNSERHRLEDIETNGDCCFNHIIGLPKKNGVEKPLYDYEKIIFDNLQSQKHIWIKKATGLGITEFFLRYIAWLCLRNNEYQGSQICIVTGPNIDIAIKLIKRLRLNIFRIGIEWVRIEPEKGHWDENAINHYKEMIMTLRERGLIPVISLNHATLPLWVLTPPSQFTKKIGQNLLPHPLKDIPLGDPSSSDPYWKSLRGWENHETVYRFIKYVERIVLELKDQVDYWITIGEPVATIIGGGYIAGLWPPGFFLDGDRVRIVLRNLIEAHVQAYNKITILDDIDADEDGFGNRVGFSHLMMEVVPAKASKILGVVLNIIVKLPRISDIL